MNVFAFRNRIIEDYARFSRSFTRLRADDIQNHVDAAYAEGRFWPAPLIQLNPNFVPGKTIGQLHPFTVVSLAYIESERRRDEFIRACPEFVIVEEAHTCVGGASRHLRYRLLRQLAQNRRRHILFLTATPHSSCSVPWRGWTVCKPPSPPLPSGEPRNCSPITPECGPPAPVGVRP